MQIEMQFRTQERQWFVNRTNGIAGQIYHVLFTYNLYHNMYTSKNRATSQQYSPQPPPPTPPSPNKWNTETHKISPWSENPLQTIRRTINSCDL